MFFCEGRVCSLNVGEYFEVVGMSYLVGIRKVGSLDGFRRGN